MAKVFRIHNTGTSQPDWFASAKVGHAMISQIQAQDKKGTSLPTSIPSPFARMDLVRNAFALAAKEEIEGDSDIHKLISDTFDIGQMLFNYQKHREVLKLIPWNYDEDLSELMNSSNDKQRHLGETLKLFLDQDTDKFNFDKTETIFMLEYNGVIIGGTSPRTLFFASPKSHEVNVDIRFGGDVMLDNDFLPLYKRESNYVKYIYGLSKSQDFHNNFPEVNEYLVKNLSELQQINQSLWQEISDMPSGFLDNYESLTMPNNAGVTVSILKNLPLKQITANPVNIGKNSDFVIAATQNNNGLAPLVLPQSKFTSSWRYTTDLWDSSIEVPEKNEVEIDARSLPGQGDKYPYIIANDFLSETIIKLPFNIDSSKFYTFCETSIMHRKIVNTAPKDI